MGLEPDKLWRNDCEKCTDFIPKVNYNFPLKQCRNISFLVFKFYLSTQTIFQMVSIQIKKNPNKHFKLRQNQCLTDLRCQLNRSTDLPLYDSAGISHISHFCQEHGPGCSLAGPALDPQKELGLSLWYLTKDRAAFPDTELSVPLKGEPQRIVLSSAGMWP